MAAVEEDIGVQHHLLAGQHVDLHLRGGTGKREGSIEGLGWGLGAG